MLWLDLATALIIFFVERVFKYEFIDSGRNKQPEQRRGVFRTQLKSEGVYLRKFLTANSRKDTLS